MTNRIPQAVVDAAEAYLHNEFGECCKFDQGAMKDAFEAGYSHAAPIIKKLADALMESLCECDQCNVCVRCEALVGRSTHDLGREYISLIEHQAILQEERARTLAAIEKAREKLIKARSTADNGEGCKSVNVEKALAILDGLT